MGYRKRFGGNSPWSVFWQWTNFIVILAIIIVIGIILSDLPWREMMMYIVFALAPTSVFITFLYRIVSNPDKYSKTQKNIFITGGVVLAVLFLLGLAFMIS